MNAVDQVLKLAFQSLDLSLQPNYALDDVSHMILVVLILDLLYTKTPKKKNPFINYFQITFRFRPKIKFGETRHTYCELGLKFVNWLNVLRFVAELVAIVVVKLFPICMMNRSMNPHSNQCQKYRIHRFVLPCLIVILYMRPLDAIEYQINIDIVKSIDYEKLGIKKVKLKAYGFISSIGWFDWYKRIQWNCTSYTWRQRYAIQQMRFTCKPKNFFFQLSD